MNKRPTDFFHVERQAVHAGVSPMRWVPDTGSSLFLTALLSALFVFLVVAWDFLFLPNADAGYMAANPTTRAVKLGLLALGGMVVLWRASLTWLVVQRLNVFFLGFLLLVPLSALWSIDPGATIARFISLVTIVMVSLAFTLGGWHPRRLQNVFRPVLTVLLFLSIMVGILIPEVGIMETDNNAWRGIFSQKNPFGQLASFGVIFWFHAALAREVSWWKALSGCLIAGACLVLSKSSTSMLATFFALVLLVMLMRSPPNLRRYMPYVTAVFAIVVLTYALAVLKLVPGLDALLTPITSITGKDLTFSNRSEIWVIIKEHIALSPWFGSGYGAYWTGPVPTSASFVFMSRMYFYPSESHNGYLEIVNDLGFIGLIGLFGYLAVYVRQSLQLFQVDRAQGALFLALFFQQAIINLSESTWMSLASVSFVIMAPVTVAMARAMVDQQLLTYFGPPH